MQAICEIGVDRGSPACRSTQRLGACIARRVLIEPLSNAWHPSFRFKRCQLREDALPVTGALHKDIRRSFLGGKRLTAEFRFRPGQGRQHRAIGVGTNVHVIGFHQFMRQHSRFDRAKKTRPVDDFPVWIDNDPIVRQKLSDRIGVVADNGHREILFPLQQSSLRVVTRHPTRHRTPENQQ